MKLKLCIVIGVIFLGIVKGTLGLAKEDCQKIHQIDIQGLHRTDSFVVLRELGFKENSIVCPEQLKLGLEQLQAIGLFSKIESKYDQNKLVITVKERWTTIPIFKINSGGGVSQITLGVYDPNLGGQYLESGLQYENLAGANSGVVWFKNPRLFNERQGLDLQYWNTRRIRIKYNQSNSNPEITNGFLHLRARTFGEYFKELSPKNIWRISLEHNFDHFKDESLPTTVKDQIPAVILPPSTEVTFLKTGWQWGRIVGESQSLLGTQFQVSLGHAHSQNEAIKSFNTMEASLLHHSRFSSEWQLSQRLLSAWTDTDAIQYWHYLGGLDRIRGFSDNRFYGRFYLLNNSELRYLFLEKPRYLLQAVTFLDAASIEPEGFKIMTLTAASIGGGIRVILPDFYRFVVRLDFARPIVKNDRLNFSFGVQQFF